MIYRIGAIPNARLTRISADETALTQWKDLTCNNYKYLIIMTAVREALRKTARTEASHRSRRATRMIQ